MAPNPAAVFYSVFEGRADHYWTEQGMSTFGSAYDAVQRHCFKGESVGLYPMAPINGGAGVKWGCVDIDNGSLDDALTLHQVLEWMDLWPWLEVSKSKGYHLWVFADDWVPARIMRRALLHAKNAAQFDHIKEVNPKAESFDHMEGGLGNLVRLPYVGFRKDENGRRAFMDPASQFVFPYWQDVEGEVLANRVPLNVLRKWANRYVPPKALPSLGSEIVEVDAVTLSQCNPWLQKVIAEGVADWRREPGMGGVSSLLERCAHEAKRSGLSPERALGLLHALNTAWGKYNTKERADKYLTAARDKAYGR